MVILIKDSILLGDGFSSSEIGCFANLALSSLEGQHLVICGRNIGRVLCADARLGERERAFYRRSVDEYTSLGGVIRACSAYIKVVRYGGRLKVTNEDGKSFFQTPLTAFNSLRSLAATKLLCENLSDCRWLTAATTAFMRQTTLRKSKLNLELIAGGGDATSETLRELLSFPDGLVICVVDSDKKPTAWKIGETAKKCIDVAASADETRFSFILLPCHELENLTPDELLDDPRTRINLSCKRTAVSIARLSKLGLHEARLHVDIKKGLKLEDIWKSWPNPDFSERWRPFVEALENGLLDVNEQCQICAASARCCRVRSCACTIFEPLGGGLLPSVEQWWKQAGTELWRGLPSFLMNLLNSVCAQIASFGCAPPRQSV
jgi:hypothetical protein